MKIKIISAILLFTLLLTACSKLVEIKYKDGLYIDSANGINYINASVSYEPVSVGAEYAKFDKTTLYEIKNADPKQWLTEAYEGIGSIFYSDTLTLPEIGEFGTDIIHICTSEILTMSIGDIEDADALSTLIAFLADGEQTEAPTDAERFYLKCGSSAYPFLYYNLMFIKSGDGNRYLYDRGTKRCVEVGNVIDAWLPDDEALIGEVESDLGNG